jgi:hypothetical protein
MRGKFRRDHDGHNYFIPEISLEAFDDYQTRLGLLDFYGTDFEKLNDEFLERFELCQIKYPPYHYLVETAIWDYKHDE